MTTRSRVTAVFSDQAQDAVLETVGIQSCAFLLRSCLILLLFLTVLRRGTLLSLTLRLAARLDVVIGSVLDEVLQLQFLIALLVDDFVARGDHLREHARLRLLILREDGFVEDRALIRGLLLRRGSPLDILAAIFEVMLAPEVECLLIFKQRHAVLPQPHDKSSVFIALVVVHNLVKFLLQLQPSRVHLQQALGEHLRLHHLRFALRLILLGELHLFLAEVLIDIQVSVVVILLLERHQSIEL